jgi:hypothetical protein
MIQRGPLYLLCIDLVRATVTRYERRPGAWGCRRLERANIVLTGPMPPLGGIVFELQQFRMTGKVAT